MKLPKPKKLPSGSWNVNIMVDGRRVSVTRSTEKECVAAAAELKAGLKQEADPERITVGRAMDKYIELKAPVLSPSTIAGYKRIRKNLMQDLMGISLRTLTQERIQRSINSMCKDHSPKTVRNAHGLLSAVLEEYHPGLKLRTALPQKKRPEINIPTEDEMAAILQNCIGTRMELPVMLAMWMGLRASEIRGLTWECIKGEHIHIKQAVVLDADGKETLKTTKTVSGDRYIKAPQYILDLIDRQPRINDHIVQMTGQAMCKAFSRLCAKWGLPHFRFHDLRHASASVSLMLGVPDKYSMRRMGHATDNMLKTVYQHTLREKEDEYANYIDSFFYDKLHTKLHTKNNHS